MSERFRLSLLISFLLAIIGGVLAGFVFDLPGPQSFLGGLLLFIIAELFLLLLESEHSRAVRNSVLSLTKNIRVDEPFSNYYLALTINRLRLNARGITHKGINISKEDTTRIWTECVANCNSELLTTSYVLISEWWSKEYADPNVELRKSKARQCNSIRTLFLWDDSSEISDLKPIADNLKSAGINASHAPIESLKTDHVRDSKLKRIGTPDFGIIDSRWVFLHYLDESRQTKGGFLTDDTETVEACRILLNMTPGDQNFNRTG